MEKDTTLLAILEELKGSNPSAALINVELEGKRLRFSQFEDHKHSKVSCKSTGNLTVQLEQTLGYEQAILFIVGNGTIEFHEFCAGDPLQCRAFGQIPETPFTVDMHTVDIYTVLSLIDRYEGKSSLGTFSFEMKYFINGQRDHVETFDPQIENQGTSGGPGEDEPGCS